jgi:5-formyltetrahydrofolate cyclo-ligase
MTQDKLALRARMRSARDAFVANPHQIAVPADYTAKLRPGVVVAAYVPLGSEADPAPLMAAAIAAACGIALPHVVDRRTPMRFLRWTPDDPLEPGRYGLRQPRADAPEVAPDIVLVPMVAFDARLNRLGQGAGYYDRALACLPDAWRIGVAWSVQQVAVVPVDRWDVPLHGVATESAFLTGDS